MVDLPRESIIAKTAGDIFAALGEFLASHAANGPLKSYVTPGD
jgi:hypothetical protein